jgi:hypothetical protein
VAASADTAATAAGCGRTDTLNMRFPSITFPAETMLETGMWFLFFQAAAAKYHFCSCFSRPMPRSRNIVLVATVHAKNSLSLGFGHRFRSRPSLGGVF